MSRTTIDAGGVRLSALIEGREGAPWVAFAHSLATDATLFDEQARALGERFRTLRFDMRGHGRSEAPPRPYALAGLVRDVGGLWDALGIERSHFVGLSIGGMTGLGLALDHPDRLVSLTACDCRADAPEFFRGMWNQRQAIVDAEGLEGIVEPTIQTWFTEAARARNPALIERVRAMIRATSQAGYLGCGDALKRLDYKQRLGEIRIPTLMITSSAALARNGSPGVFSVLLLVTFGFGFNALQSYTVASSFHDAFGIPTIVTGIGLVIVLGLIIFGGIKRIAAAAEIIVPVMAVGYILIALIVILYNITEVPRAFMLILRSAFGLEEAFAGGMGAAIAMGVRRGLFSSEAGLGSAPNVAAVAYVRHPANQGIVQAFSVFIDTLIICSCTAFMILLSGIYSPELQESSGVALTQSALADHVGEWGRIFVSIALMLFAFSSMIYNYYLGENSLNFFSEENKTLFNGFRVLTLALVMWGSLQDLGTAFGFADGTMALLAVVNLAAVVLLIKVGLRVMRDYDEQRRAGIEHPVFDPDKFADLDIDREAWTLDQPVATPA